MREQNESSCLDKTLDTASNTPPARKEEVRLKASIADQINGCHTLRNTASLAAGAICPQRRLLALSTQTASVESSQFSANWEAAVRLSPSPLTRRGKLASAPLLPSQSAPTHALRLIEPAAFELFTPVPHAAKQRTAHSWVALPHRQLIQ